MKVFVYGTLKKGWWNNHFLEDAKFLGPAVTYESYALYNYKYPFAVHEMNEEEGKVCLPVEGELYEVDRPTLEVLDELEQQYNRLTRPIISYELGMVNAIIYEYPSPNPYGFKLLCSVENNNYVWKG